MPSWADIALALIVGPVLWLAGAVFFDVVHWLLHVMLRSRFTVLRALAWPHAVHHRWIDRELRVNWELQRANVACHIVPEFLTQLVFTGAMALIFPLPAIGVVLLLQCAAFAYVLSCRGLDPNHREVDWLDAHRPHWMPFPAYHALHHVHPDAYYSAYTKLVDWMVGAGLPLPELRCVVRGPDGAFARAFADALLSAGVASLDTGPDARAEGADVLVLLDPDEDVIGRVEALASATRRERLPPEVWALREAADDAVSRHYQCDVRVHYRVLSVPDARSLGPEAARTAAERTLFWLRRGMHFVPSEGGFEAFRAWRRFRSSEPQRPGAAAPARHRAELATAM